MKTGFHSIDGATLLERVSGMPITSWDYKTTPGKRHIGPMAPDFHAAFGLNGDDETRISEVDIAGVSLAAIQELNHQLHGAMKKKDAQIAQLEAQLSAQNQNMTEQLARMRAAIVELKADTMVANRRTGALVFDL